MLLVKKTRDLIKSTFLQCNIIDVGDIINTTHRMKEMSFAVRRTCISKVSELRLLREECSSEYSIT